VKKIKEKITPDMLHEEHNLYPQYRQFHLVHNYDRKSKNWQFMGYRCMKCGVTFKRANTVPNHPDSCRETMVSKRNIEDVKLNIVTVNGKKWEPIDFNQN
jgi:transposase-like protein